MNYSSRAKLSRPSWDESWAAVSKQLSQRSLCVRAQVGAVITDEHNRIVATGYNGPPRGFYHGNQPCTDWCARAAGEETRLGRTNLGRIIDPEYNDCPALHAEENALSVCDQRDRRHGTIYVTSHMCFHCAKLVANSGLDFVMVNTDESAEHRRPQASYEFLQKCRIAVIINGQTYADWAENNK